MVRGAANKICATHGDRSSFWVLQFFGPKNHEDKDGIEWIKFLMTSNFSVSLILHRKIHLNNSGIF